MKFVKKSDGGTAIVMGEGEGGRVFKEAAVILTTHSLVTRKSAAEAKKDEKEDHDVQES
jgi:hypothetical protein